MIHDTYVLRMMLLRIGITKFTFYPILKHSSNNDIENGNEQYIRCDHRMK